MITWIANQFKIAICSHDYECVLEGWVLGSPEDGGGRWWRRMLSCKKCGHVKIQNSC